MTHDITDINVNIICIEEIGNSDNRQYTGSFFEFRKKKGIRSLAGIEEVENETSGRQPESIAEVVDNISQGIKLDFPPEDEIEFPRVSLYSNLTIHHQEPGIEMTYKACYRYRKLEQEELEEIAMKLRETLKQHYTEAYEHLEEVEEREVLEKRAKLN